MKWAEIQGTHINTNQIQVFYWDEGELRIHLQGDMQPIIWDDPDRELYKRLCRQQGTRVWEEEDEN